MKTPRLILFAVLALSVSALVAFAIKKNSMPEPEKIVVSDIKEPENQPVTEPVLEAKTVEIKTEEVKAEETVSEEPDSYNWEAEAGKREAKALADFPAFLAHFPKAKFPLEINKETLKKYQFFADATVPKDQHFISQNFKEILPELESHQFSRESYNAEYHYVARFKKGKDLIVVLVASSDDRYGNLKNTGGVPNVYVEMLTFDKNGKRIGTERIAYIHPYSNGHQNVVINKDLSIEAEEFTFIREKDVEEVGFEDNPIKGEKIAKNITYSINEKGEIKAEEKVLAKM